MQYKIRSSKFKTTS